MKFTIHDLESAPEDSKPLLEAVRDKFGFIPNITAIQAESPALLKGYLTLSGIFAESGLSPAEQQTVLLAASRANKCHYCVAAHTGGAIKAGLSEEDVEAVRKGGTLADSKLDALARLTKTMAGKKGWVEDDELQAFLDAGYEKADIMHVILGIAAKTMTHYLNHIADTPLDGELEKFKL